MKAIVVSALVALFIAAVTGFVAAGWSTEGRLSTLEGKVDIIREQVGAIHSHLLGEK